MKSLEFGTNVPMERPFRMTSVRLQIQWLQTVRFRPLILHLSNRPKIKDDSKRLRKRTFSQQATSGIAQAAEYAATCRTPSQRTEVCFPASLFAGASGI